MVKAQRELFPPLIGANGVYLSLIHQNCDKPDHAFRFIRTLTFFGTIDGHSIDP